MTATSLEVLPLYQVVKSREWIQGLCSRLLFKHPFGGFSQLWFFCPDQHDLKKIPVENLDLEERLLPSGYKHNLLSITAIAFYDVPQRVIL